MNLGSFVIYKVDLIDAPDVERLVKAIANLYVSSAAGVDSIFSERNAANESVKALPSVIPHQIEALSHSEFCSVFRTCQERLVMTGWSATCLNVMEQEHQYLVWSVSSESALRADFSLCNYDVYFDAGRYVVKGRFESLNRLVGGVVSIFPGTAQVESEFSIIKIEKDDLRISLTDLSLKGIIYNNQ